MIDRHRKLIQDENGQGSLYFDLPADPGERNDLSDAEPAAVAELRDYVRVLVELALSRRPVAGEIAPLELSPEDVARLKSLGYLGGE